MSDINILVIENLNNQINNQLFSAFNVTSNYNPHLNVRPLSTEYQKYKQKLINDSVINKHNKKIQKVK